MSDARLRLLSLLDGRLRVMRLLARPHVDGASVLHWLGKIECVIALKSANEYVAAARTQIERIELAATAWNKGTNRASVFHEIHYYFICWDAVWKRLKLVKQRAGFAALKPILQKYRVEAEHYASGRDQLEHYDDWLAGRPRHPPLAAWDHGNLYNSIYSLAGRKWDVSRTSLERLQELVREFAAAVMNEGRGKLIARDLDRGRRDDIDS